MYGPDVVSETTLNGSKPDDFYANDPASNVFKIGFNLGLIIDYRFNNFLSLGLGTSYINKGAKINVTTHWNSNLRAYETISGDGKYIQNFRTIEIPLTFYIPIKNNDIYVKAFILRISN